VPERRRPFAKFASLPLTPEGVYTEAVPKKERERQAWLYANAVSEKARERQERLAAEAKAAKSTAPSDQLILPLPGQLDLFLTGQI
jgi:hypothetical protein